MPQTDGSSVDVVVVGGGLAGFASAMWLQAAGLSTVVLEAHQQPGGCAGFWRTQGFSFDVGATTFVDFEPHGVGGRFLSELGVEAPGEVLPGYRVVLPDRTLTLWRDPVRWHAERLAAFGDSPGHRRFWKLIDDINRVFWPITRAGKVRMPMAGLGDVVRNGMAVGVSGLPRVRYLRWTVGDALRHCGLHDDVALNTALGMVLEDTVHSTVEAAPLINGAMGLHIRGAGLTRFAGGARGLWKGLIRRYRALGGQLVVNTRATEISPHAVRTTTGLWRARHVISALPIASTRALCAAAAPALTPFVQRDAGSQGGAILVMLGVPESEVANQPLTHHGLFQDYDAPFGLGNNMFVSVSSPGDVASAPRGHRAVMISTHCELAPWQGLDEADYQAKKQQMGSQLVAYARRVYPTLGDAPVVYEVATPRTYERFTSRPSGAVGGVRQRIHNTNLSAVPHDIGIPWLSVVGDTTWPGLGTVSCLVGAASVRERVLARM